MQDVSFHQQVIALTQAYPCPRCPAGILEPFGLTETFRCNNCHRAFVPLKEGRLLYPAHRLGWKVAPTFWWDGVQWHCAGTTATNTQLLAILALCLLPILATNLFLYLNWWNHPSWCTPGLTTLITGLISLPLVSLLCWDFTLLSKK